jgi:DNA-directed RNA polymerase subunit RPC12/RpoP
MAKETKKRILNALDKNILKCPECRHEYFIRKTYDRIMIVDTGETIFDDVINEEFEETIYICQQCGCEIIDWDDMER